MTGSFTVSHLNVVALVPSNVAIGTEPAKADPMSNAEKHKALCMAPNWYLGKKRLLSGGF